MSAFLTPLPICRQLASPRAFRVAYFSFHPCGPSPCDETLRLYFFPPSDLSPMGCFAC